MYWRMGQVPQFITLANPKEPRLPLGSLVGVRRERTLVMLLCARTEHPPQEDTTVNTTHFDDVVWPEAHPIASERVISGSPQANTLVLFKDERSELGLWQISPGVFTTIHDGYVESVTIASGRGRLVHDDGTVTELRPGSVAVLEQGWAGRWVVEETIVKSYAVITVDA
jgi:uncharacterized cupin superfamily protein